MYFLSYLYLDSKKTQIFLKKLTYFIATVILQITFYQVLMSFYHTSKSSTYFIGIGYTFLTILLLVFEFFRLGIHTPNRLIFTPI